MPRPLRLATLFAVVAVLHFVLSVAGIIVALPAAFDAQAGGFWAAPGKWLLATTAGMLLAPLEWLQPLLPQRAGFSYGEIALVSVLFGAAAVGLAHLSRLALRQHK